MKRGVVDVRRPSDRARPTMPDAAMPIMKTAVASMVYPR
jgi:hypothetical protein